MNNQTPKDPRTRGGQRRPVPTRDPGVQGNVKKQKNGAPRKISPVNGTAPSARTAGAKGENELLQLVREFFDSENLKSRAKELFSLAKLRLSDLITAMFHSKERIFCGIVTGVLMIFLALLQTTLFSTIRPFGAIPDLMLSFVLALSVTEGRRWGAVWGIVSAVVIESLSVPDVYLMPLLYMLIGYFGGIICRHYLSESAAVRAVLTVAVIPLKGAFTAVYMILSPIYATAGEIFFDVVLPEAGATLLLAAPVHILVYLCLKHFHHTRADMVAER